MRRAEGIAQSGWLKKSGARIQNSGEISHRAERQISQFQIRDSQFEINSPYSMGRAKARLYLSLFSL